MSATTGAIAPTPTQTINFTQIPYNIQVPGTFYEVHANYSQSGLVGYPARALIIGQALTGYYGGAPLGQPVPVFSANEAEGYFGNNSIAAQMAASFIAANPYTELYVIGVSDEAGSVKASATMTLTGTATQAGTLMTYLAGVQIQTPVNIGDTAAVIAGNFVDAFEETTGTVATVAAASGVLTFTALQGGTLGNTVDLRFIYQSTDALPVGINVAIVGFSGGATDPTIAAALATIATSFYTDITMCWNDTTNVGLLEADLVTRYEAMGSLDAHAYRAIAGSPGTLQSAQAALNSRYASVIGFQNPLNPTWVIAASLAGVASYNLANDPSRQLRDLALPGILAPAPADRFTITERNILLGSGISTFDVEVDGTVTLERVVTEYLTSPQGLPDSSWHDIMIPKTMSRIRYDWIGYVSLTYPRNKLADDGTLAAEFDSTVVTPSRLQGSWAGRSRVYAELGWIEHSTALAKQALFVRDQTDPNRVNARQQVQIIGNLMILAGSLEFSQ